MRSQSDAEPRSGSADRAETDGSLDPEIHFDRRADAGQRPARIAFLTGATGFLGANLLNDLLAHTALEVWCLTRAAGRGEAIGRLKWALEAQGLPRERLDGRVRPVLGDLGAPRFGLDEGAWEALGRSVDVVYHSGAQINFLLPYRLLRRVNVVGTETILRLAAVTGRPVVHFVSSTKVFGAAKYAAFLSPASIVCRETFEIASPPPGGSGYAQTKWAAERMVVAAAKRGLSASIYRLGMLTPHSVTGGVGADGAFSLMLLACARLCAAPELNADLHLTPVDVASRAIVELSGRADAVGRARHLMNPGPIAWSRIVVAMREAGVVAKSMPYVEWRRLVVQHDRESEGEMEILSALLSSGRPPFASAKRILGQEETLAALAEGGVAYPRDNLELLARYFARARQSVDPAEPDVVVPAETGLASATPGWAGRADAG